MLGRKNPMSHLSRMKNPVCLVRMYLRPCGPTAISCTVLLGCFSHLRNHYFLLWLIKAGVHYIPAMPCQLLAVSYCCCFCFPYLNHPLCAISYINHCYIHYASFPPKAYQKHKGDSFINYCNIKASGILCIMYFRYFLCL